MDLSIFRSDIWKQESASFFKNTFIIPKYLKESRYNLTMEDQIRYRNDIKEKANMNLPKGLLNLSDHYLTESFMKRCFNKCRQFVLEDWIDYNELDCTMKCAILHKKSFEIMKETYENI